MSEIEVQIKEDVGDNEVCFCGKMILERQRHNLQQYSLEDVSWDRKRFSDEENFEVDNYVLKNYDELFDKFIVAHKVKVKDSIEP